MWRESNSGFWSFVRSEAGAKTTTTPTRENLNTLDHHHIHHDHHQVHQHHTNPVHSVASDRHQRPPHKRVRFSDCSENDGDPRVEAEAPHKSRKKQSNDELCPATAEPRVAVAPQFGWRSSPFFRKKSHYSSSSSSPSGALNIPTFSKFNWSSRRVF